MILNALADYYDRLAEDPKQDVAPFGFSRQKISFEIILRPDGSLFEFHDARKESDGRRVPKLVIVLGQAKPTGSGINPCFLWDNAQYLLGFKVDDPKPERTMRAFEAFRERHLDVESEIDDEAFSTVCRFLQSWDPSSAAEHPELGDISTSFGVFRILGAQKYVHERAKILTYWRTQLAGDDDTPVAPSLVSGEVQPIARLHQPSIKGVRGAQSSGATIVSFNLDAFESYGKSQSYNAPVGVDDAFKYCTALNRLTSDSHRRVNVSGTTIVFWSEKPTPFEDDFGPVLDDTTAEDQETLDRLRGFFNRLRSAREGDKLDDADVPFYVLGLAPNASRLSVRFWMAGTVQQLAERLGHHLADLELDGAPDERPLTIRRLALATAKPKKGRPDEEKVSPLLVGGLLRSVLSGSPYPQALLNHVVERIRAEAFADKDKRKDWRAAMHCRTAILKAFLNRNHAMDIAVRLDAARPEPEFQLGRLFAVLERIQNDAHDRKIERTIRHGILAGASVTPSVVFPRLLRLSRHHTERLATTKEEAGQRRVWLKSTADQQVTAICDVLESFPHRLSLNQQALFFVGYYQQREELFTSNTSEKAQRRRRPAEAKE